MPLSESLDRLVERLVRLCAEPSEAAKRSSPGAYVLPAEVKRLRGRRRAGEPEGLAADGRVADLGPAFDLSPLELDLLFLAAAPDLDERVERLCGYAHDDLTRRRPTPGLAARLLGLTLDDPALHAAIGPRSSLVMGGLVQPSDDGSPFASRALRCNDRVVRWIVGIDDAGPPIEKLIVTPPPVDGEEARRLGSALNAGLPLTFVNAPSGSDPRGLAVSAAGTFNATALVLDLDRVAPGDDLTEVARASVLEARLRRAVLVAGPIDRVVNADIPLLPWTEAAWPIVLYGACNWDPRWSRRAPLLVTAPAVRTAEQVELWSQVLDDPSLSSSDIASAVAPFRLTGEEVIYAAAAAATEAAIEDRPVCGEDLRRSARARNTRTLEKLARRVHPQASWDDIILPATVVEKLRELVARSRYRELVYGAWALSSFGPRGDGLSALFAGPSGTGKTLAAEVVAAAVGLDLYIVDLSTVVDKFIGETEKNLERIFDAAESVNGVLLFDEADALFGKRSEVKDAHDRYANLETAYLLQRMEAFGGTTILTTNLRTNLDDAFARRLDCIVNFPAPDADCRLALWRRFLGGKVPVADDVDIDFCAKSFTLTGADIRNVAVTAAFLAADAGAPVGMAGVVKALEREYEKLGRLRSRSEFGPYAHLLSETEVSETTAGGLRRR